MDLEIKTQQLDRLGYAVIPGLMSNSLLSDLRTQIQLLLESEGDRAGEEFKQEPGARRLANLVNKGAIFLDVISNSIVTELVKHVLGISFKLSSLNTRQAIPGNDRRQPLHCDMAAVVDDRGYWVCNCIWLLNDFNHLNGAIRVVPGSHRWGKLPHDLVDPMDPHPEEMTLVAEAGSVIVMNAHLWHGGLANQTSNPRTAIHAFYCRRDKPQQQNQKSLLAPELQEGLSDDLRFLLALDDHDQDLTNEQHQRSGFLN